MTFSFREFSDSGIFFRVYFSFAVLLLCYVIDSVVSLRMKGHHRCSNCSVQLRSFGVPLLSVSEDDICPQSKLGELEGPEGSGFCSMKRVGVFVLHLDGILVHRSFPPGILSGC